MDDEEDGNYINCDQCNLCKMRFLWSAGIIIKIIGVHAECDGMNEKQFKAAIKSAYMCPLCRSKV